MKLTKCPFCGRVNDSTDPDVLSVTGTYWRDDPEIGRHYFNRLTSTVAPSFIADGQVWEINCPEIYGGCDVQIRADSRDEVIQKWETRS